MQLNKYLAWIFLCLVISSCSWIYPKYTKPQIDVSTQWAFESSNLAKPNNLPYLAWWHTFDDPVLNELIESGAIFSNNLNMAKVNLAIAQAELKTVELSWFPSLSFFAGYSTNPAFGIPNGLLGVSPTYLDLNVFYKLALQRSIQIKVQAYAYMLQSTKLAFIGQIASSYYTYLAQLEQLQLYQQYITDLNQLLRIKQQATQGGINSEIPVSEIETLLHQAKTELQLIQSNVLKSQNALRYLINQNPGNIATKQNFAKLITVIVNPADSPARVLANRPDVNLAETQYKLATQNQALAYTSLLPTAKLDIFAGQINVAANSNQPGGNFAQFSDAYAQWTIDPSVFGQIDQFGSAQKLAYYNYIDTVRKALHDVDNDLINYKTINSRYLDINKALGSAKSEYLLTNNLYQRGIIAYVATMNSKLKVDTLAITVNQFKLLQILTIVSLYQNLGGGYKYLKLSIESTPVKA